MMGWVSVDDRLPDGGKVLVCFGEPFFGFDEPEIEAGYYDFEDSCWRFWLNDRKIIGSGVTHWMPLPDPPEDK